MTSDSHRDILKEFDDKPIPGCIFCVYEMPPMSASAWRKYHLVPAAVRTVRTPKGDRDLCEYHAKDVEKKVLAKSGIEK